MKITCPKNQFLYGVNTVSKAVSNKTTMEILQCILIEAFDDCIKLTANDTELGIETVIQGTILEPGKIALEAKIFSEIIKKIPDNDVYIETDEAGKRRQKSYEIDFVVNKGAKKYYVQSALNISDDMKARQELRPLLAVNDFFKKFVITKTSMKPWVDEIGIIHLGLYDFLLNEDCFEL